MTVTKDEAKAIAEAEKRWCKTYLEERPPKPIYLKGLGSDGDDLEVKAVYTPNDIKDMDYLEDIGFPGQYPMTRGPFPTMYRGQLWTMRMISGIGSPEEMAQRWKFLLSMGATGLMMVFDLPTQLGYDSDDPVLLGEEVGSVGVAIDTIKDMEILFEDIDIEKVTTSMIINATAPMVMAMFFGMAEKRGIPLENLGGTTQNDILKEFVVRELWLFPPRPSLKLSCDLVEWCNKNTPRWHPLSFTGHWGNVANQLSAAMTYVDEGVSRGLKAEDMARRFAFEGMIDYRSWNDFFAIVASTRAGRRLWARIMKERYGVTDPRLLQVRIWTTTNTMAMTREQPLVNLIRSTYFALANILSGVQAMSVTAYDEAFRTPTEESALLALRTQQVLAYESGVTNTIDPLAGSYYVECLTNSFEQVFRKEMADLERRGGMVASIESGYLPKKYAQQAYDQQREIESGERPRIGVNIFRTDEPAPELQLQAYDTSAYRQRQMERLAQIKRERDDAKVQEALDKVRRACERDENVMPPMIEAAKAYATLGEMTKVVKAVYGEWKEPHFM